MNPDEYHLRDCGHIAPMAGICQYEGCAAQVCPHCVQACQTCGTILCPLHQHWLQHNTTVFCQPHAKKQLILNIVRRITPGLGAQTNTDRTSPQNVAGNDLHAAISWLTGRNR